MEAMSACGRLENARKIGRADGIVHHDADCEHQAEERQHVEREPESAHDGERTDEGDRDRHGGHEGRPPVLEEDEEHEKHQRGGLEQGDEYLLDGFVDEDRRVVRHRVLHILGEQAGEPRHGRAHLGRDVEGVGTRQLVDGDAG